MWHIEQGSCNVILGAVWIFYQVCHKEKETSSQEAQREQNSSGKGVYQLANESKEQECGGAASDTLVLIKRIHFVMVKNGAGVLIIESL